LTQTMSGPPKRAEPAPPRAEVLTEPTRPRTLSDFITEWAGIAHRSKINAVDSFR
jgi:hypothetical protein